MPRTQKTESVNSIIAGMWGKLDRGGKGAVKARAISAWRAVAGEEVAAHARGFALREDELLVFVDSAVWANELSVLSEHYRTAVNAHLGKELVGGIRFAVSKMVEEGRAQEAEDASHASAAQRETVQPVRATDDEIARYHKMAEVVADTGLREAVIAAAVARLEWRKGMKARSVE